APARKTAAEEPKPSRAFGKLPNEVARDRRLSPAAMVAIAYRVTIADDRSLWGLSPADVKSIVAGKGFGRNVFERAMREARDAGYIQRWQPRPVKGQYQKAKDVLTLPPCGASGKAGWHLERAWFDGRFALNELAALLFLRAGTGNGPAYAREL